MANPEATRVGWIGVGVMGRWMCEHLLDAGYKACVFNRTVSKCQPLVDKKAMLCGSPKEVAMKSDVVFTIVGYPKDVEEVILGPDGVLAGFQEASDQQKRRIVVDMTTTKPALGVQIYEAAKRIGAEALDAPCSGGDIGARLAKLTIMCGGDTSTFDYVYPLFVAMSKNGGKATLVGGPGDGHHTKMTNQILIALNIIGVVEALVYAYNAKLDIKKVLSIIEPGAAGSWSLSNYGPRMLSRNFDPGFFVDHFVKDMGIALEEAKKMEITLPGLAFANSLFEALQQQGGGSLGIHGLMKAIEHINGNKFQVAA